MNQKRNCPKEVALAPGREASNQLEPLGEVFTENARANETFTKTRLMPAMVVEGPNAGVHRFWVWGSGLGFRVWEARAKDFLIYFLFDLHAARHFSLNNPIYSPPDHRCHIQKARR